MTIEELWEQLQAALAAKPHAGLCPCETQPACNCKCHDVRYVQIRSDKLDALLEELAELREHGPVHESLRVLLEAS